MIAHASPDDMLAMIIAEIVAWSEAMLKVLDVPADVQSGSPLHLGLLDAVIEYRELDRESRTLEG